MRHCIQRNQSFGAQTGETPVDALREWVQSMIPEQHVHNLRADKNDGWNLFRLVEALEGRAFEQVPTDMEECSVFALKYADEKMDVPAQLDACDMVDPMVVRKSMMTYIAQFQVYEQLKRARRGTTATRQRSTARKSVGSSTRANFNGAMRAPPTIGVLHLRRGREGGHPRQRPAARCRPERDLPPQRRPLLFPASLMWTSGTTYQPVGARS